MILSFKSQQEVTRDLHSLNLLAKLMMLHRQILFSLAIAAIADIEQLQSLHRVAPMYSKLVTSAKFRPFMLNLH